MRGNSCSELTGPFPGALGNYQVSSLQYEMQSISSNTNSILSNCGVNLHLFTYFHIYIFQVTRQAQLLSNMEANVVNILHFPHASLSCIFIIIHTKAFGINLPLGFLTDVSV